MNVQPDDREGPKLKQIPFDYQHINAVTEICQLDRQSDKLDRYILALSADGMIQVFDPMQYKTISCIQEVYKIGYFSNFNWTRGLEVMNKDTVLSIGGYNYENIKIWGLPDLSLSHEIKNPGQGSIIIIRKIRPDQFLTGGNYGDIKLWNLEEKCIAKFYHKEHRDFIEEIAILPGGAKFLTASRDRTVKQWDIDHDKSIRTFFGNDKC